jgi:hypothetical protein
MIFQKVSFIISAVIFFSCSPTNVIFCLSTYYYFYIYIHIFFCSKLLFFFISKQVVCMTLSIKHYQCVLFLSYIQTGSLFLIFFFPLLLLFMMNVRFSLSFFFFQWPFYCSIHYIHTQTCNENYL